MTNMKNSIIKGTIILTLAGIITRLIGFFNRIFLANLIGTRELGIYQLIFPIYIVAFSLSCQGIALSLTKLVSEYISKGKHSTAKKIFNTALTISLLLGILTSILIFINSDFLAIKILKTDECIVCLRILSIAIPFICIKGIINGFFLGLKNSAISATSLLIEQVARVGGIYIVYAFITNHQLKNASLAVCGIVIGEICACLYSISAYIIHMNKLKNTAVTNEEVGLLYVFKVLLKDCVPLTINRLSLTLMQSFEAILIPSMLMLYYKDSNLALALYGTLTGIALPFIMFPSTITNSLSTMLLPTVSSANASKDVTSIGNITGKSLHFCILIGCFSTIVFLVFGKELGYVVFGSHQAGDLLYMMSLLCPFIYVSTTLSSILNGLGKTTLNLIYFVISVSIRICFIIFIIPRFGISGYLWGLLLSYLVLTLLVLLSIKKRISIDFNPMKSILIPLFYLIAGIVAVYFIYIKLLAIVSFKPLILLGICLTIYLIYYGLIIFIYKLYR